MVIVVVWSVGLTTPPQSKASSKSGNEYLDMDISQLMQITITSVAKKPQNLADVAAAAFVITQDDIHRSGVTSIPEALRMAPGLQVARIDANKWAITSRGLSGNFGNALLVMIDGRTVYSPTSSGVYWDAQSTLLDDIDRIEVIRGPGATVWGANAVNGVVNIITKKASDTQGGLTYIGAGSSENLMAGLRYGTKVGDTAHGRAYMTYNAVDSFKLSGSEDDANDDWNSLHGGFRLDGERAKTDSWTLQGDIYSNKENQLISPLWIPTPAYRTVAYDQFDSSGGNLLGRWQRELSATSLWSVQLYYDYTKRDEIILEQTHNTFDFDFSYQVLTGEINDLSMGTGYRRLESDYGNTFQVSLNPESESNDLFSAFFQDEILLFADTLWLTLGAKWEHNDFTGHEIQPNARLLWKINKKQAAWAAISRAVRTPSLLERTGSVVFAVVPQAASSPQVMKLQGNNQFDSEELLAYEAGYRLGLRKNFSFDLSIYYNDYDRLATTKFVRSNIGSNLEFANKMHGSIYGLEFASDWDPTDWWEFKIGYTYIGFDLQDDTVTYGSVSNYGETVADLSPKHQISVRSTIDIIDNVNFNLWFRYVDTLHGSKKSRVQEDLFVDEYVTFDANVSWRLTPDVELMLVGQNLLNSGHLEYISEFSTVATEVPRSAYCKLTYHY